MGRTQAPARSAMDTSQQRECHLKLTTD